MKWIKSFYRCQGKTHILYESEPIYTPCRQQISFCIHEIEDDENYRDVGLFAGNSMSRMAYGKDNDLTACMEWCRAHAMRCYDVELEKGHIVEVKRHDMKWSVKETCLSSCYSFVVLSASAFWKERFIEFEILVGKYDSMTVYGRTDEKTQWKLDDAPNDNLVEAMAWCEKLATDYFEDERVWYDLINRQ